MIGRADVEREVGLDIGGVEPVGGEIVIGDATEDIMHTAG